MSAAKGPPMMNFRKLALEIMIQLDSAFACDAENPDPYVHSATRADGARLLLVYEPDTHCICVSLAPASGVAPTMIKVSTLAGPVDNAREINARLIQSFPAPELTINPPTPSAVDFRDRASGQFAHRTLDVVCVCGHPLGVHAAETVRGLRPCFNGDSGTGEPCDCEKFRKTRKRAKI